MRNKYISSLVAFCILMTCCFGLGACSSKGILEFKLNDDGQSYTVTKFNGTSKQMDVEVPSMHNNKPITKIADFVFASKEYIKNIKLSETIEEISDMAFAGSQQLEKITVGEKSAHFSDVEGVLYNKDKTVLLQFPAKWKGIAFDAETSSGVVFTVPESVVEIQGRAFYKASSITELVLPAGLKRIGDSAFLRCVNMKSINLPDGLLTIEKDAFLYCQGLNQVVIPVSVTEIGDYAFNYANNMEAIYMKRSEVAAREMKLGKDWIPNLKDKMKDKVAVVWAYEEGNNE